MVKDPDYRRYYFPGTVKQARYGLKGTTDFPNSCGTVVYGVPTWELTEGQTDAAPTLHIVLDAMLGTMESSAKTLAKISSDKISVRAPKIKRIKKNKKDEKNKILKNLPNLNIGFFSHFRAW